MQATWTTAAAPAHAPPASTSAAPAAATAKQAATYATNSHPLALHNDPSSSQASKSPRRTVAVISRASVASAPGANVVAFGAACETNRASASAAHPAAKRAPAAAGARWEAAASAMADGTSKPPPHDAAASSVSSLDGCAARRENEGGAPVDAIAREWRSARAAPPRSLLATTFHAGAPRACRQVLAQTSDRRGAPRARQRWWRVGCGCGRGRPSARAAKSSAKAGARPHPLMAAAIVAAFAAAHEVDDPDLISFAAGAVAGAADADDIDAAVELLAAACDAPAARDVQALKDALTAACAGAAASSPPRPAPRVAADASPSALVACLDLEGRRRRDQEAADEGPPTAAPPPEPGRAAAGHAVDALARLFPAASRAFLAHALLTAADAGDDAAAAAAWITDRGDAGEAEAAWLAARAAADAEAAAAAAADEAARARTLDRFAEAPVVSGAAPPRAWGGGDTGGRAKKGQPTTRFLGGRAVTTRDKYVVVQDKPEWDGGSRGKVKTKGKRGTGVAG